MSIHLRIQDQQGNRYDVLTKSAATAPLPEIGERVEYHLGSGTIVSRQFKYENDELFITLHVNSVAQV